MSPIKPIIEFSFHFIILNNDCQLILLLEVSLHVPKKNKNIGEKEEILDIV